MIDSPGDGNRVAGDDGAVRIGIDVREWRRKSSTGIARILSTFVRWTNGNSPHELFLYGNQETEVRVAPARGEALIQRQRTRLEWDQLTLPRLLVRTGADVFLSPYYKAPLRAPCPVVVTASDLIDIHFPRGLPQRLVRPWWMRLMLRRATHVLTLSEWSRSDIVETLRIAPSHVTTFPLAVDERFLKPLPASEADRVRTRYGLPRHYVLYIGRCTPHKNVSTLVSAWGRLSRELTQGHDLVLAGGDVRGFGELVAETGVDAMIPGFIRDTDLPGLYAGATLMCFPSLHEGFGLPPLEAMACGTPVIAANATSIPEVVDGAALLVDPTDAEAWSQALARLMSDDEARARLVAAGGSHARRHTAERSAAPMLDCLVRVARGGGA
jgi:alpha-1,3-rhamnosyl/mannosyltransferase